MAVGGPARVSRRTLGIMSVPSDPDPRLQSYADPQRLVTTEWLAEHLGDEGLVVVESDEDVLLYEPATSPVPSRSTGTWS